MEINIKLLKIQNQWWDDGHLKYDPILKPFDNYNFKYQPEIIKKLSFKSNSITVVQGARGVGKTTIMKLFIRDLIEKRRVDPKNIFYYSCHNLNSKEQLNEIIKTFIHWRSEENNSKQLLYIFIDEATLVKGWERGLRYLEKANLFNNTSLLLSGSVYSGINSKSNLENKGWQYIKINSLSFREVLHLLDPDLFSVLVADENKFAKYKNRLEYYLDVYFLTGGYLSAVNSFMKSSTVKQEIYSSYLYWIIADIARIGRDLVLFRQILEELIGFQGRSFGFQTLAKKTKARTHNTIAEYIEVLQDMFISQVLYQFDGKKKVNKRASKRICFRDPFIFWVFYAYLYGSLNYWHFSRDFIHDKKIFKCLIGNTVFSHLLKGESFVNWGQSVAYWRSSGNKIEIPFIDISSQNSNPIIVRYRENIISKDIDIFKQAGFSKGMIISRDTLDQGGAIKILPLSYFLLYH